MYWMGLDGAGPPASIPSTTSMLQRSVMYGIYGIDGIDGPDLRLILHNLFHELHLFAAFCIGVE